MTFDSSPTALTRTQSVFEPPPSTPRISCFVFSIIGNAEKLGCVFRRLLNDPVVVRSVPQFGRGLLIQNESHIAVHLKCRSTTRGADRTLDRLCDRLCFRLA